MKNLKKILSLTLALAMALSLMTTALAKDTGDFADGDDVSYAEAVDVMATIGVFNGTGDGSNFDPNGNLTREQAAKIITYMLLGQTQADKLVATIAPFADVSADRWSAGAIAYCASEGIMNGTGNGKFDPTGELTGLQFAKMLLGAIGYDAEIEKMTGVAWGLATSKLAYDIELDDGLGDINLTDVMTREQAAQMALTAMKTPLVEYESKGSSISVNGAVVAFGAQKAQYVTSTIARQQTISSQTLTNSSDSNPKYTVEFAEKYCQKLELIRDYDDFGRPSYTWNYDKKEINTYADYSDMVAEFTTKVTGKDLYTAITKNVMDNLNSFTVYVDGEEDSKVNKAVFGESDVTRNNSDVLGATEKGVLTQVFVESVSNNSRTSYNVIIVIENTYLAIAAENYDSKNKDVNLDIYALETAKNHTKDEPNYIKNTDKEKLTVTVKNDDIGVEDVKDDDKFLVTIAQGKVQTMVAPEIVSDASIDSFKKNKDVTVEGKTYEYAHTAKYDVEVLDEYSKNNLKDITYNVILDKYGYLIGIEQNEDPDTYLFLTGMDGGKSNLSTKNADANVIFLDGTMKTVTINVSKSENLPTAGPHMNTWCTYSVNSAGVYTLKTVGTAFPAKGTKVAQSAMNVTGTTIGSSADKIEIDKKNVSLDGGAGLAKVYGNNDTVYLNVELKAVLAESDDAWHKIIDDVDSVTVGVRNTSLVIKNVTGTPDGTTANGTNEKYANDSDANGPIGPDNEVYTLFKDNGYIIAAVVIGEDDGVNKNYAYVTSSDVNREGYDKTTDKWTWTREAVVNGKLVDLKEVGGGEDLSDLEDMDQDAWYEIKFDADGNVKSAEKLTFANAAGKYIDRVGQVKASIADEDSVVLFDQVSFTATIGAKDKDKITYKNGTLYVDTGSIKGFDVSPEVKVVLCTSDDGDAFDEVDDRYEGYTGLESAIKNLDSNFKGELSVIFDKGSATVIIFNDLTDGKIGGGDLEGPGGSTGYDVNVLALLDDPSRGAVSFLATGADSLTGRAKRDAIKDAYVNKFNASASSVEVKSEFKPTGEEVFVVYVDDERDTTYTEDVSGVTALPGVPTASQAWEESFPDGAPETEGEHNENTQIRSLAALINGDCGDFVSWDAKFTPNGEKDGGNYEIDVTGINWISDLDSKVPFFYYDRDVEGGNNYTVKQAYLSAGAGDDITIPTATADVRAKLTAEGVNIDQFAVIMMSGSNSGQVNNVGKVWIFFKDSSTGKIYYQNGDEKTDGLVWSAVGAKLILH